ncbi:hypothetical protein BZG78_03490 [Salinivibrio sp. MA351]|uniref:hypothetical protein n=1 Tax=Salinivibrio sp. MA351 TaxID=1909453 RepID=UPI000988A4B5|nr:hypothetical protein [Salinivibrio sp. MA351]OOF00976.1 hypothetical protein BZG78_03490 [Salinivibrio sp. MA351]
MHTLSYNNACSLKDIDVNRLPLQLQEFIHLIGIEEAYRLVQSYGGRAKYIPKHPERSSLSLLLNVQSLKSLSQEMGGLTIDIPVVDHIERQIRNQQIARYVKKGESRSEIAKRFNIGIRQVTNIKKELSL